MLTQTENDTVLFILLSDSFLKVEFKVCANEIHWGVLFCL